MLINYSVSNFKLIKSLGTFSVHPITILCGTNSSGKSSFLQSLLLLRQSQNKNDTSEALILNGDLIQLGTPQNVIHAHNKENILRFAISFDYFYNTDDDSISYTSSAVDGYEEVSCSIHLSYSISGSQFILQSVQLLRDYGDYVSTVLNLAHLSKDLYTISINMADEQHLAKIIKYEGLLPKVKLIYEPAKITPMETVENASQANKLLLEYEQALGVLLNAINYIGPVREPPLRRYNNLQTHTHAGTKGQNASIMYAQESNYIISDHYFYDKEYDRFYKRDETTLRDAVRYWMDLFGFHNLDVITYEELISLTIQVAGGNQTRVNVADIGFGFSQLFPVILQGLRMSSLEMLLLEQPEIHLHPGLQMKLADFIISLALSDKQIIVETHSEHIINRLVRRIIEDETDTLRKLSGIHFFSTGPRGFNIEDVMVNDIFGITNWPKGFFDQSVNEKEQILFSSLRKRQARRGDIQ